MQRQENEGKAPKHYFELASFYYAEGRFDEAMAAFSEFMKLITPDALIFNYCGCIHYAQGKRNEAIADYSLAIELDPNLKFAYQNRGCVHHDNGNIANAIQDFTKAIELDRTFKLAYENRGRAHQDLGEWNQAIDDFTEALKFSRSASLYNNLGYCHHQQGNLNKAIFYYSEAIKLDPKYPLAYKNRGCAYQSQGELIEAMSDYAMYLKLDTNDCKIYKNRGTIYMDLGRLADAVSDYTKAIDLDPDNASVYYVRGLANYRQGNLDKAKEDFSLAIVRDPNYKLAYKMRALIYQSQPQPKHAESIADYIHALNLDPKDTSIQANLKSILDKNSKKEILDSIKQAPSEIALFLLKQVLSEGTDLGQKFMTKQGWYQLIKNIFGKNILKDAKNYREFIIKDIVDVRNAATIIAQGSRDPKSFFGGLGIFRSMTPEEGVMIAAHVAKQISPPEAEKIALSYFKNKMK